MQKKHLTNKARRFPPILPVAIAASLGFISIVFSTGAYACAACSGTLSKDWETQGISGQPGFVADLSYDYVNQNQQRYGRGAASSAQINNQYAAGQEVEAYTRTRTATASLIYNDDDWGASIQVPYVWRDHGTYGSGPAPAFGSSFTASSDSSIGDIKAIGRYTGFSSENKSGIMAGAKFATGNTGANFNTGTNAGAPLDASLQTGTGSTDIILGGYTTGIVDHYGLFLQGTVQHAVATQNNFRPGDTYALNIGIRYAGFGAKVSPMLQLNIIKRQADTGTNATPPDPLTNGPTTGGTLAYLAPGISVRVGGGASVYGFVQLPVYQNVNSLQINPRYTVTLGLRQSF